MLVIMFRMVYFVVTIGVLMVTLSQSIYANEVTLSCIKASEYSMWNEERETVMVGGVENTIFSVSLKHVLVNGKVLLVYGTDEAAEVAARAENKEILEKLNNPEEEDSEVIDGLRKEFFSKINGYFDFSDNEVKYLAVKRDSKTYGPKINANPEIMVTCIGPNGGVRDAEIKLVDPVMCPEGYGIHVEQKKPTCYELAKGELVDGVVSITKKVKGKGLYDKLKYLSDKVKGGSVLRLLTTDSNFAL